MVFSPVGLAFIESIPPPVTRAKDAVQEVGEKTPGARMGYYPESVMGCSGKKLFLFSHKKISG